MQLLKSETITGAESYNKNLDANKVLASSLKASLGKAAAGGPSGMKEKHTARGKLLVRERIEKLLDPHTAFLELSPLAANGQYKDEFPSAGIVTGIGTIHADK
ncbi:carboxyl transferase domain-containing protein [Marinilabilia salmonicolor]|uniref:carboxyl transferase domain-containing protein n=1 Tax=Marinilabilia salmonicolor TaxID=989 RepID=UPI000A994D7A|nr:carboxyl transferase domain-containing protein [Marinilabilia salmonicolor]